MKRINPGLSLRPFRGSYGIAFPVRVGNMIWNAGNFPALGKWIAHLAQRKLAHSWNAPGLLARQFAKILWPLVGPTTVGGNILFKSQLQIQPVARSLAKELPEPCPKVTCNGSPAVNHVA